MKFLFFVVASLSFVETTSAFFLQPLRYKTSVARDAKGEDSVDKIRQKQEGKPFDAIVFDEAKCIACGRCVPLCSQQQGIGALTLEKTGPGPKDRKIIFDSLNCIKCGQCTVACPTGAIHEWYDMPAVLDVLRDKTKIKVASVAPSVRVSIAEEFKLDPGQITIQQIQQALKMIGFDYVFDTNYAADMTIMEEGHEFIQRAIGGGVLPMFTSCCPGWINLVEGTYPELIPHLSSCKSPQGMMGAVVKNIFAKKIGRDPADVIMTSIMPCTAKIGEARRPDDTTLSPSTGLRVPNNDLVLTTRQMARMFREHKIDLPSLEGMPSDHIYQQFSGAADLFGATGGVMEAALRTAYEVISGKPLDPVVYEQVRGLDGVKCAVVTIPRGDDVDVTVRVAVVSGGANIASFLEKMRSGDPSTTFDFIEVMACPGGCIGGGGQPKTKKYPNPETLRSRMGAVYALDERAVIRRSHLNTGVDQLYKESLGEPNSPEAHRLLHTNYSKK